MAKMKSEATIAMPTRAGIENALTRRVALIQMSAILSRSSLMRENAGKNTCCNGAAMRANGIRITVVARA